MMKASLKAATVVAIAFMLSAGRAEAGTYTVVNTNDTGAGSFRQGILDANSNTCTDPCTIVFDPTAFAATQTIFLTAFPFPTVTANNVFIDGFSGGTVGTMNTNAFGLADNSVQRVVINGISNTCCPITVTGANFRIRGVVLQDFITALQLQGTNAVITGNKIGTDAIGSAPFSPPNVNGILVTATGSATIGGTLPAERNLISGNTGAGIDLQSASNTVIGNYIGTNAAGTGAIPNGKGVTVLASNNAIGNAAIGNVISGHATGRGVEVTGGTGTTIYNNRIGTNIAGTGALANSVGVAVGGGLSPGGTIIGGSGLANLISGNNTNGIDILTSSGANNISFNVIGLNNALSATIPNSGVGINITGGGTNNQITNNFIGGNVSFGIVINGATGTTIQNNFIGYVAGTPRPNGGGIRIAAATGTTTIQQNSIRNNGGIGVDVDNLTIAVAIKQNEIADNTGIGIDLHNTSGSLGPTPNDAGDSDTGAGNHLQNFPAVLAATVNGSTAAATLTVRFNIDSASVSSTASLRAEVFKADTDPTNPEGFTFLQGQCFSGNNISNATMTIPSAGVLPGERVVMTATSYSDAACTTVNEGTSEFSPGAVISLTPGLVINTNDSGPGSLRQAITDANNSTCASPCAITFNIPTSDPGFAGGVFTIQPTSALPDILASNTALDGGTQTLFSGDTNVNGPEIVINGALAGAGARGLGINGFTAGHGVTITIRNVVVNGFSGAGISISVISFSVSGTQIRGNYIGTDASGLSAVPNGGDGIFLSGIVTGTQIGAVGAGNLISGNGGNGITLSGTSPLNSIRGNKIGTNRTGAAGIPNGGAGILISSTSTTTVGGTGAGEANTIAFNSMAGVAVTSTSALNSIRGNSIHSNTFLGIDLSGDLVTPNDAGDPDTGPNALQNYPVLTLASYNSGTNQTTFTGTLNSVPSTTFDIDWYSNTTLDGTGFGEGQTWLATSTFTTDALGNTPVSIVLPGNLRTANVVTTASRVSGGDRETSEFSAIAGNIPPTAVNDNVATNEDVLLTLDPRTNDTDPEGGVLQITSNTQPAPAAGSVSCTTTSCTFTPVANYNGPASFTYTITDDMGATATATVNVTVNAVNDAPVANADSLTVSEDTPGNVNVISNDTDVDGPTLTVTGNTNGALGTASCTPAGLCTYTPNANASGADSFTYTLSDGSLTATGTVNVTITPVNDPPVANNDTVSTNEDAPLTFDPRTNDTDPEGGVLQITSNTQPAPAAGSVTCTTTSCTFTPVANYNGPASFTYTITDDMGATATATVNVTVNAVNDAPVANADSLTVSEDTPGNVNVISNDTDVDGPTLTVTGNTNGALGTVSCTPAGLCTYTPNANASGADSFTYTLSDGSLTATGTVNVTITPVNDPPVANNDTAAAAFNTPVTTNVTANDTDVDGGPLSVSGFTQGSNGTVSCAGTNCTYTPNSGFTGSDSYTYTISDGAGGTAGATVNVTVAAATNNPPVANDDNASVTVGQTVTIMVLVNDFDPDGQPITVTAFTQGSLGSVSCTPAGRCTYSAGGSPGNDTFTYTISDGNGGFDTATVLITIRCPTVVGVASPNEGETNFPTSGTFFFNGQSSSYTVYMGPAGGGCNTRFGTTSRNSMPYSGLEGGRQYEIRVEGSTPGCSTVTSSCVPFTTVATCNTAPPTPISPVANAVVPSPITFTWSGNGAPDYTVFASINNGPDQNLGTTSATSLTATVEGNGSLSWFVVANNVPGCGSLRSARVTVNVCNAPPTPTLAVVAEATSGQTITVSWNSVGAAEYVLQAANNAGFSGAEEHRLNGTSMTFTYNVTTATPFFYRVRAISTCDPNLSSPFSIPGRAVIIPIPPPTTPDPNANVPAGSRRQVIVQVFVPGVPGQTLNFTARVDKPWMQVRPSSGRIGPEGLTFDVILDPSDLTNGTFTGTLIVDIDDGLGAGGRQQTHGITTTSTPVSVSLVTPVQPSSQTTPPDSAMIIPVVGHLDAADRWRSDVRIANVSTERVRYQVTLTPADPQQLAKQTILEADAGTTVALDDIVRLWYGLGSLGESAAGMLEIRPLNSSNSPLGVDGLTSSNKTTVVSSRTFNISPSSQGTLGQYIPGIPFVNFIGRAAEGAVQQVLSLQQISQNSAYRTNLGVVEGSGSPASVMVTVFDVAGNKLKEVPLDLRANEQRQINSFLAQQNLTLDDGRVEVRVTGGSGKVTAYASVVDNRSRDQLFAPAVALGQISSSRYVMPGVADLNTGAALWRSDLRIFNSGPQAQSATITFYPQNNGGAPSSTTMTINPGEVKVLDDVLRSVFSLSNTGGAVHVSTATNSSLAVTGRTYNQTQNGTLGQFIPAVTPAEAIGLNEGGINLVQLEDSVRYRTNIGLAETTGNAATVELTISLPDSKVAPRVSIPLAANEFRQIAVLRDLGIGNVYNARIAIRVVDGSGRVTAYGSLIDQKTQDSTYIPAQ